MKYRSNRLDPRIISGLRSVLMPTDVLTEEKANRFSLPLSITVGYAAECLMDFQNLGTDPRDRLFRIVKVNYGSPFPFRCRVVGNSAAEGDFSFFLPADQVAVNADLDIEVPAPSDIEAPAASDADDSVGPFATPLDFPAPTPMTDEAARFAQKFRVGSPIRYRRNLIARQKDAVNMRRGVVAVVTEVDLDNGSVVLGRTRRSLDYLCRLFEYFDPNVGDWRPFKF